MKREKPKKPYWEMTAEELAAATAEFDRELLDETFPEPPPEEKAKLLRAMRKLARQHKGRGTKVTPVSLEKQPVTG
jgi:hypothetical protein